MSTYTRKRLYLRSILLITVFCLITPLGCAKVPPFETMGLKIDRYKLSTGEFNELFSEFKAEEDTPRARKAFLENLITRKIILQEAQRQGLDKQKDFLKAIERFWEQSLITIVIDKKTKELSGSIVVTEQEIQNHYNKILRLDPNTPQELDYKLRNTIRLQLIKQKQAEAVDAWIESLRTRANIKINKKALGIN